MADFNLEEVKEHILKMQEASKEVERSYKETQKSWGYIGETVQRTVHDLTHFLEVSGWLRGDGVFKRTMGTMVEAFEGKSEHLSKIMAAQNLAQEQFDAVKNRKDIARDSELYAAAEENDRRHTENLKIQWDLTVQTQEFLQNRWVQLSGLIFKLTQSTMAWQNQMNAEMVKMSGDMAYRLELAKGISVAQLGTSSSSAQAAEAVKSLARYGLLAKDSFNDSVSLAIKMQVGLGVATDTTAQLLAISKNLGVSWTSMADTVAQIRSDTALTGQEAAELANSLSQAAAMFTGSMANLPGNIGQAGAVAAAYKSMGLNPGDVTSAMTGLQTAGGITGNAMLGLPPDFMQGAEGGRRFVEAIARMSQQLPADSMGRLQVAQRWGSQIGVSGLLLANGTKLLEAFNKQLGAQTTLEKEWQEQAAGATSILHTVRNVLSSITHLIFINVAPAFNTLNKWLSELNDYLGKSGETLKFFGSLLAFTVPLAVIYTSNELGKLIGWATRAADSIKTTAAALNRLVLAMDKTTAAAIGQQAAQAGQNVSGLVSKVKGAGGQSEAEEIVEKFATKYKGPVPPVIGKSEGLIKSLFPFLETWGLKMGGWMSKAQSMGGGLAKTLFPFLETWGPKLAGWGSKALLAIPMIGEVIGAVMLIWQIYDFVKDYLPAVTSWLEKIHILHKEHYDKDKPKAPPVHVDQRGEMDRAIIIAARQAARGLDHEDFDKIIRDRMYASPEFRAFVAREGQQAGENRLNQERKRAAEEIQLVMKDERLSQAYIKPGKTPADIALEEMAKQLAEHKETSAADRKTLEMVTIRNHTEAQKRAQEERQAVEEDILISQIPGYGLPAYFRSMGRLWEAL